ncbi:MAG: peptidylprolyl isomerase [Polyangiaceae bacterium]
MASLFRNRHRRTSGATSTTAFRSGTWPWLTVVTGLGLLSMTACDGTLSGMHATRGELPVLSPEPVPTGETQTGPREIRASHLLVMFKGGKASPASVQRTKEEARARALEALDKARNGANFEALVAEYSDEPAARDTKGDLGRFTRKRMVKAFADAAFALEVGQISEVVESEFGFHVIRRTE